MMLTRKVLAVQGTGDNFYQQKQLLPENFLKAARDAGYDEMQVRVRSQEGYDHSYFFVSQLHYNDSTSHLLKCPDLDLRRRSYPLYVTLAHYSSMISHLTSDRGFPSVHANFLKA